MPSPTDRNLTALPTKTVKPPACSQARHFTQLDQVTQLVGASEADAEIAPSQLLPRGIAVSLPCVGLENAQEGAPR